MFKRLIVISTLLTLVVIIFGAYVRLSDAGLGCPDWPGCYGKLLGVPDEHHEKESALKEYPEKPVETSKAWKEMIHRYLAATLGGLLLAGALVAWGERGRSPLLPTFVVLLAVFQALLGMWTVTLQLKPLVVTLHLLGGMSILGLLTWMLMQQYATNVTARDEPQLKRLKPWARWGLFILFIQIALGGWVSANYAALACSDFPLCQSSLIPNMDFYYGFEFWRRLGVTSTGELLSIEALRAIHWTHRVGALITFLYLGALSIFLFAAHSLRGLGLLLLILLFTQISLGIANVLMQLPLSVAVAHNGVAALLFALIVMLNFKVNMRRSWGN